MAFQAPARYYDRFDPAKQYDRHLFRAGYVAQSAEFNELQSAAQHRLKTVADALFADGDIIGGAELIIDRDTGLTQCQAGLIYLRGAVHPIAASTVTIPTEGEVTIGAYLAEEVISEIEDDDLRDPALEMRNYREPGALRLRLSLSWGVASDDANFVPVYRIVDGVVMLRAAPDSASIAGAISDYDLQSSGGNYVSSGMTITRLPDSNGMQQYSVTAGLARVEGWPVEFDHDRRIQYLATPSLATITAEPHVSAGAGTQRIDLNHTPVASVSSILILAQKTETVTHGPYSGVSDDLEEESVQMILSVVQGETTYTEGDDYTLTGGDCDWSPGGNEPAPGSSYAITYQYYARVLPEDLDDNGFSVTGAINGSSILVTYEYKQPRWDRLCIDKFGDFIWQVGAPREHSPIEPAVPNGVLLLASVYQDWSGTVRVREDSVRMVSMREMKAMRLRIDDLYYLMAVERLRTNALISDPASKRGVLVDPFINNDLRDQGGEQTALIVSGVLTLSIPAEISSPSGGPNGLLALDYQLVDSHVTQKLRTDWRIINQFLNVNPLPASVSLEPSVDHFVIRQQVVTESVQSTVTVSRALTMEAATGNTAVGSTFNTIEDLASETTQLETMRPLSVQFSISGFLPDEALEFIVFDGIDVTDSGV